MLSAGVASELLDSEDVAPRESRFGFDELRLQDLRALALAPEQCEQELRTVAM